MKSSWLFDAKARQAFSLSTTIFFQRNSERLYDSKEISPPGEIPIPNEQDSFSLRPGILLENLEYTDWKKRDAGQAVGKSDPPADTSLRQFRRGTVLNYGFVVYNAKPAGTSSNLTYQTRIFRDGKPIFESAVQPVAFAPNSDPKAVDFSGALALGVSMLSGDYVLQISITDNLAKAKNNTATQFVQFEVVE